MSVTAMSRTFWTEFPPLAYTDKKGKQVTIKDTTAKVVLLAIADNADDYGENSYQSFETLAKKSSIDRRSVMRVVRALATNDFLKVAGISVYGTNNYSINLDKLGQPPAKRARTGRPKSGNSEALVFPAGDSGAESGDSGAESGDSQSPESSFNRPQPPSFDLEFLKKLGLDWVILAGKEVTQDMVDKVVLERNATTEFERIFKFGTLPWSSNSTWTRFQKFIVKIYSANRSVFKEYKAWRDGDGKYTAFSNRKIRENPGAFMDTGYPEFEASKMYSKSSTPAINEAEVERTRAMIEKKTGGIFSARPDNVPAPALVNQKLQEAAQKRSIRK